MSERRYVLLVDDDPAIAEMYRLGLEGHGFRVGVMASAMNLNQEVGQERPDILVLDWELPGIRGDEALERLRQTEEGWNLPVFILSNFSGTSNGAVDRVFAAGAVAWLEKTSTTPDQLARRLDEALSRAGGREI